MQVNTFFKKRVPINVFLFRKRVQAYLFLFRKRVQTYLFRFTKRAVVITRTLKFAFQNFMVSSSSFFTKITPDLNEMSFKSQLTLTEASLKNFKAEENHFQIKDSFFTVRPLSITRCPPLY